MLVLNRRIGERIRLVTEAGEIIWIRVENRDRNYVRLMFEAPPSVKIIREELLPEEERRGL